MIHLKKYKNSGPAALSLEFHHRVAPGRSAITLLSEGGEVRSCHLGILQVTWFLLLHFLASCKTSSLAGAVFERAHLSTCEPFQPT